MKIIRFFDFSVLFLMAALFSGCKSQQVTTPTGTDAEITRDPVALLLENTEDLVSDKENTTSNEEKSNSLLSLKNFAMQRDVESALNRSSVFSSHFTGFSLYDIDRREFIVNYNADKHFTPASNVKILTLYAALKTFGANIPGMMYRETSDTLFLRPVGDPTLLHQFFADQPIIDKIGRTQKPVTIEWPNEELPPFGIGWMWDDYSYGFQPELAWMPIYGNVVHFEYDKANLTTTPDLFNNLVEITKGEGESNKIRRAVNYNYFYAEIRYRNWAFEKDAPFKYSQALASKLLRDAIQLPVNIVPERKLKMDTLYSQPIDTVLRRMMQESDNFISEQLLVMAAWKNGFADTEAFREFMIANWLPGIEPVWMDGSGISRYNLIRPIDEVRLLNKLYKEFGWLRIQSLFPQGGKSGTIIDWYPNESDPSAPYIIAKTGTLSNNHTLSGYLKTRSGKLLIFSFMNNNYVRETDEVKKSMQQLLESIRDSY